MVQLLVIGGPSFDRLGLPDRTVESAGGAGMYTAMAAHRCGVRVTLFGLRPEPCPGWLEPVDDRLAGWLGPAIDPEQLPQFEISYREGKTEYLRVSRGAEPLLSPSLLPADLSAYDHVHVTPQAGVPLQLSLVQACRERGARRISAGTDPGQAAGQPQSVRAVLEQADDFFMNDREAVAVFGSLEAARTAPGKLLFVTRGDQGARIILGDTPAAIPAVPATVRDPTGAGDAFCGATLAFLLQKHQPIMAAHRGAALAAEMMGQVGPAALLSGAAPPEVWLDPRVRVDEDQIRRVAEPITSVPETSPYPWVGATLPPVGHPKALDYLFAATLHQFSFWTTRDYRYHLPLIAPIDGVERKGSDYLWAAVTRRLERDPDFCSPERQADLRREDLLAVFRSDDGQDPMPALDLHVEQARRYGRDMLALQLTPQTVLDRALASPQPLDTFLLILDHIGGYKEDPLRKKSTLLALGLSNRPERFFPLPEDQPLAPIMDYHIMRASLRMGLIEVLDGDLRKKLIDRQVVSAAEEWAVRYPAYLAYDLLAAESGRTSSDLNGFMFGNARHRCPEMTEPDCPSCAVDAVCAHHKTYFQPVLRTTFY